MANTIQIDIVSAEEEIWSGEGTMVFAPAVMGEIGIAYADNPYLRGNGSWQYQYMLYLGLIIGGGTSQIQKNIISERGLGMPKEPKVETK